MAKMTSAFANKLIRQLDDEKSFHLLKERNSCTYTAAVGESPVIPEYDYVETAAKIESIDEKIQIIKHAINKANVENTISIKGKEYSVDTILIRMTQLNRRKSILDSMRNMLPKERLASYSNVGRNSNPEYRYINFNLDYIKKEYARVSEEIMEIQIALDMHNHTFEFEVAI